MGLQIEVSSLLDLFLEPISVIDLRPTRYASSGFVDYLVKLYCFLSKWSLRNLKRVMFLFPHQGGNAYINTYPTGRFLRYAKLYEIGAGTSEI